MSKRHIETPFTMNLPRNVTIGAIPYEVRDEPVLSRADEFGECHKDKKVIEIHVGAHLTLQQLLVTWWHEVIHGVACEYGIRLTEKDTDRMAQGITQAFEAWMRAQ